MGGATSRFSTKNGIDPTRVMTLTRLVTHNGLFFLSLLLGVVVFVLNIKSIGPMIQADESSYLANAAAIAGYPNDMASSYHAGYSLLIAPVFWFTASPSQIWLAVKIVNSLLYGCIVLLLGLLNKILFLKSSPMHRIVAVFLTAAYPMWVIMAGYSFPQVAFVLSHLIVLFLLVLAVQKGSYMQAGLSNFRREANTLRAVYFLGILFFLGLMTGFVYWVHPMGIPVIAAAALAIIYWCLTTKKYHILLVWFLGLVLSLVFYKLIFVPWLHDNMTISGLHPRLHYPNMHNLLSRFQGWDAFGKMLALLGGQVLYILLGTVGLIWVGVTILMQWLRGKHEYRDMVTVYRVVALFLLSSLIGSFGLSVIAISGTPGTHRLDHWIYGRYVEGVLAPVLLLAGMTPTWRRGLWAVPSALVAGLLLHTCLGPYSHTAPFNVPTFWQEFFIREYGLWVWMLAGIAIIVCLLSLPKKYATIGVASFFIFNIYLQLRYHEFESENAAMRSIASLVVRQHFEPGTCVGYDFAGQETYGKVVFWNDLYFQLHNYSFKRMSYNTWLDSCQGPLFSYDKRLLVDDAVVPIAITPGGGPILFTRKEHDPLIGHSFYPVTISPLQPQSSRILLDGWYDIEWSHVWSSKTATLNLPVPQHCRSNGCEFELKFTVYGASQSRPVNVLVGRVLAGEIEPIKSLLVATSLDQKLLIPVSDVAVETVIIQVPEATSPRLLMGGRDERVLGIALKSIEVK